MMKRQIILYNPNLKELARTLRKSMTYSEVKLWNSLKAFQMMCYDFDRQRPMLNYVVDFYCKDVFLVIEVDGITHHDEQVFEKDEIRDEELAEYGITVLRFNALDVVNKTASVLKVIENWLLDYEESKGVPENVMQRRMNR